MVDSMDLKGRRVLIFQQRMWAINIGHHLAVSLKARGARLAALTVKKEAHDFLLSQNDVEYDLIVSGDEIKYDPESYLGDDDYSLEEICRELGVLTVWEIVQSMRNHVKSYGDKYYYGYKQNIDDEGIIQYIKATYKNIRRIFDEFNPEVIASPNFVALQHIMFNLYARQHGVEMIGISDTKVSDALYFSHSYLEDRGPFIDRFNELQSGKESPNLKRAQSYLERSMKHVEQPSFAFRDFSRSGNLLTRIKAEILPYYQCYLYYRNEQHKKKDIFGVTADNLSPRYILRDHYAKKLNMLGAKRFKYSKLEDIKEYAFTPLQSQPETTMDTQAARFNNQLETIRQVAMSLPGNMTLVVKDHPNMRDRRPVSYLEKIARTPNVKLIDSGVPAPQVMAGASLVVAPGGTVISEATMLRKPTVQVGGLYKTRLLPNVFCHTDFSSLPERIREALDADLHRPEYMETLTNYVAAMYDIGFPTDYLSIWEGRDTKGRDEFVERYVREIFDSMPKKDA